MLRQTDRVAVWRMAPVPNQAPKKAKQAVYHNVPCTIVPVSSFDRLPGFARESTDVVFWPRWLTGIRKDDELRVGRRLTEADGTPVVRKYSIDGIRRFRVGVRHIEIFVKEITA